MVLKFAVCQKIGVEHPFMLTDITQMSLAPYAFLLFRRVIPRRGCNNHPGTYTKGGSCQLPLCCIVNNDNRFIVWYDGSFYGVTDVDPKKTISYIEVFVD